MGIGLGLAAFFWLPAIADRNLVHTERLIKGGYNFVDHFLYVNQLIYSPWGYGDSNPGPVDGMDFSIGMVQLSACAVFLAGQHRIRKASRFGGWIALAFGFLMVVSVFMLLPISTFIWKRLQLLQYFQFPWRFLSLVSFSTAFISSSIILIVPNNKPARQFWLMVALWAVLVAQELPNAHPAEYLPTTDSEFSPQAIDTKNININTFEEFEPIWMLKSPAEHAAQLVEQLTGESSLHNLQAGLVGLTFQAEVITESKIRINIAYFPGWVVQVDGNARLPEVEPTLGVMVVNLEPGSHIVTVQFTSTTMVRISEILSVLALVALLVFSRLPRAITGLA